MRAAKWTTFIGAAVMTATLTMPSVALADGPTIVDVGLTAGQIVNGTVKVQPAFADESLISRVELKVNHYPAGSSVKAPFALSWDSRSLYDADAWVEIVAYDRDGNETTSPVVVVHVDNNAPFIYFPWILSDANPQMPNMSFTGVVPVDFAKNGVDDDTAGIQLSIGSQTIGVVNEAPWTINWDTTGYNGRTTLTARAWDRFNNSHSTSSTVWADHTGPTVAVDYDMSPGYVRAGGRISATIADGAGIGPADLLVNGVSVGTYPGGDGLAAFTWPRTVPSGPATMTVRARDLLGNVTDLSRTVIVDNDRPVVTASPATTLLRGNVTSAVTVRDSSGVYSFGTGFDHVQTVTMKSPLRITLNSNAIRTGKHTLIWQVSDRAGNLTVVTRTVTVDNAKPSLRVTAAPASNSKLRKPTTIKATATDTYGVSRVELLINGKIAAVDQKAAYRFTVNPKKYGKKFTFQLRAYDKAGNVTYSPKRTYRR
ncbi:Ig-like domain-containing protein [Actinoplanes sp. NPDC026619]|uniref:Ig-like domain-containing protein n=1 Tax=Actinoplanes sp. NPDC026619 TaxID=3155798 RepID=UPI0033E484CC